MERETHGTLEDEYGANAKRHLNPKSRVVDPLRRFRWIEVMP
jgi:hypothetical protein